MSQEIELRFAIAPEQIARLARQKELAGITAGNAATRRLSTVYYDTPERAFAKAGFALRVRKSGRNYIQTVKTQATGALSASRGEYENKLPTAEPDLRFVADPDIREKLVSIADGDAVAPLMETQIRRITRALTTAAGDEIELALDRGEIRTLTKEETTLSVSEVELELKRGSPSALYDVARLLAHETPLVVNLESKAERGLRAMEGKSAASRKAGRIELAADATCEEAYRACLSHCLRHVARNSPAVAEAQDPEGVHQLRVGLRRLRVALSILGEPFRNATMEALRSRAKTLSDAFGLTRELDVFVLELLTHVERAESKPDLTGLREALERLRRDTWAKTVALVRSEDFTGFVLDLASAIETRAWREGASAEQLAEFLRPARAVAGAALSKRLKKAKNRAQRLARLGIAERHRLRIALKKLRYASEFFAPHFDAKAVEGFQSALSRLQDLFGALNDAATAEHILNRIAKDSATEDDQGIRVASAFILGWQQSRIPLTWEKAKKRWKRFAKIAAFWEI